jgi:hypothetical protein
MRHLVLLQKLEYSKWVESMGEKEYSWSRFEPLFFLITESPN